MSFKVSSDSPNIPKLEYVANAATGYVKGTMLFRNTSTGEVDPVSSTAGNTLNIECVAAETVTTAASDPRVDGYPITGVGQLWVVDCNIDTADDQLNKAHNFTNSAVIDNTSTTDATSAGVFVALRAIGAAGDRKLLGYFVKLGQVAA